MWDLGGAAAQMMVAAWELGIGSVPGDGLRAGPGARAARPPDGMHCEYILSFGYPADPSVLTAPPKPGGRRSQDEVLHRERWEG